jgi:hypothetical protein
LNQSVDGGEGIDTLTADYSTLNYDSTGIYVSSSDIYQDDYINGDTKLLVDSSNVENLNITGTQFDDNLQGSSTYAGGDTLTGGQLATLSGIDSLNASDFVIQV